MQAWLGQYVSYLITSPKRQTTKFGLVLVHAPLTATRKLIEDTKDITEGQLIESQVERKRLLPLDWNTRIFMTPT